MINPATGAATLHTTSRREDRQRRREQRKLVYAKSHKGLLMWTYLKSIMVNVVRYALLICLSYLILTPLLRMISTTFKHPLELGSPVSIWIPARTSLEHFFMAFETINYPTTLPFTILSVSLQVVLQMFTAMLAGYSFARLKFKGQNILFAMVILTIVVPAQAISLPQYLNFRSFDFFGIIEAITGEPANLLNSPLSLYILAAAGQGLKGGLYIYIFRQGFRGLPRELEESAFVDGSGYIRTFFRIVLPSSGSSLLTVGVLSFVWNWNDMYFVNLFSGGDQRYLMVRFNTATARMDQTLNTTSRTIGEIGANFEMLVQNPLYQQAIADTMSLLVVAPLIIFYLIVQNRFVQSAERSGIVG